MTYGIKVAVPGYPVETAADINLSLKTDFTLLKVFDSGTVDLSTGTQTVTHNLGYIPQYLVFGVTESNNLIIPASSAFTIYLNAFNESIYTYVNTTQLVIIPDSVGATNMVSAIFYIFYEQL